MLRHEDSSQAMQSLAAFYTSDEEFEEHPGESEKPSTSNVVEGDADYPIINSSEDEAVLQEPPPPSRPEDPSSDDSEIEAPGQRVTAENSAGVSRLVSYEGEVIEESDKRSLGPDENSSNVEAGVASEFDPSQKQEDDQDVGDKSNSGSPDQPGSELNSKEGSTVEELDVDDYLEKALEGKTEPESLEDIEIFLPPKPKARCSEEVQRKFDGLMAKKQKQGLDVNRQIQGHKNFRNPSIYEKLIEMLGFDEIGTNFSPKIFNPHAFKPSDKYDVLAKRQKEAMEKYETNRKNNQAPPPATAERKKPSRFDQPSNVGQAAKAAAALHMSASAPNLVKKKS